MALYPRTTGIGNGNIGFAFQQGTIHYASQNLRTFLIDSGEPLTNKDGDALYETKASIESIMNEVQPIIWFSENASNTITVVTDTNGTSASDLQTRIQAKGNVLVTDYLGNVYNGSTYVFWNNTWANLSAVTVTTAANLVAS